jgi:hypothetical protein
MLLLDDGIIVESLLTCPHCGAIAMETMPTDACLFFYGCTGCGVLLRPKPGHCCVFCSFGTVPCPPMQEDADRSGCCA